MAILSHHFNLLRGPPTPASLVSAARKPLRFRWRASPDDDQGYLIDAPVSVGDGFSFSGGKYSDEPSPSDEWLKQGKIVKAHSVIGSGEKAKDPIFGLAMGSSSQVAPDLFRWFCVESGSADKPSVVLVHGFPSQAYSYRKVLPILSKDFHAISFDWLGFGFSDKPQPGYGFNYTLDDSYGKSTKNLKKMDIWFCVESGSADKPSVVLVHGFPSQAYSYRKVLPILSKDFHAISFDWLGFGFSDKPQPGYGFNYTLDEFVSSFESLINEVANDKVTLVVQGFFAPVVVKYASKNQDKINGIILVNPPLTERHSNLPSTLSIFSNFLLGEIFSQDPIRASDKALTSCGPYKIKEDDLMVYRRPYLTSGSSGFALNAISRSMKKELKKYVEEMRAILTDENWKIKTTVCWGERDRWLTFDGVEDFCRDADQKLIRIPNAGHHVQEDCGEQFGEIISGIISSRRSSNL